MTSALWGGFRIDDTWWQGGVKNCQNGGDVICGCPLILCNFKDVWKKNKLL